MSKINLTIDAANAAADAIAAQCDGGSVRVYEGTQPSSGDTPLPRGSKLLAIGTFGTPAFQPASGGVARANAVAPDKDAKATGSPKWFRLFRADGKPVYDGDVTPGPGGAMQMRALVVGQHAEVYFDSCVIRMPTSTDGDRT